MNRIQSFLSSLFFVDSKPHEEKTDTEPRWWAWMIVVGFAVILVLVIVAIVQFWVVANYVKPIAIGDVTRFGISGDFFGFANALFSALAFAMIIVTLWMQKHELKQQRMELDQTQSIMELQQAEMREQNESLQRQRFENTFFNMLQMHNEVVAAIKVGDSGGSGRVAFVAVLDSFRNFNPGNLNRHTATGQKVLPSVERYEEWYKSYESKIGHYFRTLYNMLRYIDEFGGPQGFMYARLVRAQLSSHELDLLLYNGLSFYGREKLQPLMEKYSLLKHLRRTPENREACEEYHKMAFGKEVA